LKKVNNIVINILTRTSNRPSAFLQCYRSIKLQTYSNINHIVSYDNKDTFDYIKELDIIPIKVLKPSGIDKPAFDNFGNVYAPYNLYCNDLLSMVNKGWVMFLDDDDRLFNDCVVKEIVDKIKENSEDTLFVNCMRYPNGKLKPSVYSLSNSRIKINDIGSPCVVFHSKYINKAKWDDYKRSDFRFIKKLESIIPNIVFSSNVTTQINNFGDFGRQNDVVYQLPFSFYKSNILWYLLPKYHQTVFGVKIFHSSLYISLKKRIVLKLKSFIKF
tara:strand:+ start:19 stop:834 length:816 start_codon:yes stop_codon:yes gene_type:complete